MNPLYEYELYKKDGYCASVGEWEEWAEKIVTYLRTELKAADNDYKRYKLLEAEREASDRAYTDECAANVYLQDEVKELKAENDVLRNTISLLKNENERLTDWVEGLEGGDR